MAHRIITGTEAATLRAKQGTNQTAFWSRVGITQSGGSRYENGQCYIPEPVAMLLDLVYGAKGEALLTKMRGK